MQASVTASVTTKSPLLRAAQALCWSLARVCSHHLPEARTRGSLLLSDVAQVQDPYPVEPGLGTGRASPLWGEHPP